MRKFVFVTAFAVLSLASVVAASARPAELSGVVQSKEPYGRASLTWLFLKAYDVSLWTDAPSWSFRETFALSIDYNMSFSTEELVERTVEEMKRVSPGLPAADQSRVATALSRLFPDVKSGDRITALHLPGRPVQFFHNGRGTGQLEEAAFVEPFFNIWLSPRTAEPSIRKKLLRLDR